MGQPKPSSQPKERRVNNLHEVVLGFAKKQNLEESRRCPQCAVATCLPGCPLGIDIPGFIRLLREDDAAGALDIIRRENPFPAICGRLCPAPCETACIFNADKAPIAIRSLERYASDLGRSKTQKEKVGAKPSNGKNIAIVGSGPAGLSAAFFLAREGYRVTVYEAMEEPGGLLRYGVPEFRLPQKVLDEQLDDLRSMGVRFIVNAFVGSTILPQEIVVGGQTSALLLTVGAGVPDLVDIPGHNAGGVYYAEEFLMRSQMSSKAQTQALGAALVHGPTTAVIGSGTASIDVARLALRLGQQVDVIFGGLEEELGVHADDLAAALEEGIRIHTPVEPLGVNVDSRGFAEGVRCRRLELVEKEGKFTLESTPDAEDVIVAQTVILSHGRKPNSFLKTSLPLLKWNEDGTLWQDPETGMTSIDKVFTAGDVAWGPGTVVDAIASGKKAAKKIAEYLK